MIFRSGKDDDEGPSTPQGQRVRAEDAVAVAAGRNAVELKWGL